MAQESSNGSDTLPKLSSREFKAYNKMAVYMDYYHEHFRTMWRTVYSAASSGRRPSHMSLKQFLSTGLQFCQQLEMHHGIEEQYVFPYLAERMPSFRHELELLTQHKEIIAGLTKFDSYLEECSVGKRELRLEELKELMDAFGEVLFAHLGDEVEQLGADNMRKYWSMEEVQKMPQCFGVG
ncbi:hypothetical protein MMC22_001458 [Lobaria immixta]|nr:hypothetical protein [Lobaria immixta]